MNGRYTHQEFPKWVQPAGKEAVIVHSLDEEERVLGLSPEDPDGDEDASSDAHNALTEAAPAARKRLRQLTK